MGGSALRAKEGEESKVWSEERLGESALLKREGALRFWESALCLGEGALRPEVSALLKQDSALRGRGGVWRLMQGLFDGGWKTAETDGDTTDEAEMYGDGK